MILFYLINSSSIQGLHVPIYAILFFWYKQASSHQPDISCHAPKLQLLKRCFFTLPSNLQTACYLLLLSFSFTVKLFFTLTFLHDTLFHVHITSNFHALTFFRFKFQLPMFHCYSVVTVIENSLFIYLSFDQESV
jgi:hypothetical protein